MLYRENKKNKEKMPQLGFGCMRFPRKGPSIDLNESERLVKEAVHKGVAYFDTAYIYPGSEEALGKIIQRNNLRDKIKIASKLPLHWCNTPEDFDRLFDKQLERLRTDRIDYYMFHMLSETITWERLKKIGAIEWIKRQKEKGAIINIGFSFHGGKDEFKKLVDVYDWDFCMIQYNYFDESNQAGRVGLQYASSKGLPVFVMEPLRGGTLANKLPEAAKEIFKKANPERTLAEWSLRWLWDQEEVTMLLSGMSTSEQLDENARLAGEVSENSLTDSERLIYNDVMRAIMKTMTVPCTACGYCMPCPAGVDIPACFSSYNDSTTLGFFAGINGYFKNAGVTAAKTSFASQCSKCGKCEKHCPQGIKIRNELSGVKKRLEPFWFKAVVFIIRKYINPK